MTSPDSVDTLFDIDTTIDVDLNPTEARDRVHVVYDPTMDADADATVVELQLVRSTKDEIERQLRCICDPNHSHPDVRGGANILHLIADTKYVMEFWSEARFNSKRKEKLQTIDTSGCIEYEHYTYDVLDKLIVFPPKVRLPYFHLETSVIHVYGSLDIFKHVFRQKVHNTKDKTHETFYEVGGNAFREKEHALYWARTFVCATQSGGVDSSHAIDLANELLRSLVCLQEGWVYGEFV